MGKNWRFCFVLFRAAENGKASVRRIRQQATSCGVRVLLPKHDKNPIREMPRGFNEPLWLRTGQKLE